MLRLLTMNVLPLEGDELFERCKQQLSAFRREKIERYRFRKDQLLSLGAGLLLDCGLQAFGLREKEMEYRLGENGKPFFASEPGIYFNLSHSNTQVLAAIGDCPVGCDIEWRKPVDLKLARRFFHEDEYAAIAAESTEEERQRLFFRIWTLKESYMKCSGLGFRQPLDSFCIRLGENPTVDAEDGEAVRFREYDAVDGYCAALCAESFDLLPEIEQVDIGCE